MNVYDDYIKSITKIGRTTMLIAVIVTLLPAAVMTWGFGFNPGIAVILAGAISQISVSGAFYFSEPISYYPIVGRAGLYMAFLSGNLVNMRIPAAVSATQASGYKSGTDEGAIMGTIGMAVSIWIGVIFLLLSVLAGETVLATLPAGFTTMLALIIPALFGGVFAQFAVESPKVGIFALVIAFVMIKIVAIIPGQPSFVVTLVSVFSTIWFAKTQLEKKLAKKEE